jgi:hypothetical protein
MPEVAEKHTVLPENASTFKNWLANRGGIAIWGCLDLGNTGQTWSTPALTDGQPTMKPHWSATDKPIRLITDPDEIEVRVPREVMRFHVAVRTGSQGLSLKVTDGSGRRIRKALQTTNRNLGTEDAWYEFDYLTQEAVIYVPDKKIPLSEWTGQ